jgi:eukaryotic-like serine/threonine-protein kinase
MVLRRRRLACCAADQDSARAILCTFVLAPGTRFGPYEIIEHLGSGGMGAVYRARDTRLDRSVAIKVLGRQSPDLRERMAREARAISNVSHPNICALYDLGSEDGIDYLVMEYLEGETLASRLDRGPLPLGQAMRHGAEIASALDVAHRAGIVHRDLKPANIMLTRSGARLLDFGLAKNIEPATMEPIGSDAQTIRRPLTEAGMVVGTPQYMSPEQLQGKVVDERSDLFGFGCVLYEMITGQRPFDDGERKSVITAILTHQPAAPSSINSEIPVAVDRVVSRCLEKEPGDRWQSARDLAYELGWLAQERSNPTMQAVEVARSPRRRMSPWLLTFAAIALLAVLALGIAAWIVRGRVHSNGLAAVRFGLALPPGASIAQRATMTEFAVSPDGSQLAIVLLRSGHRKLAMRALDNLAFQEIEGTDGALSPFWSPDGKWIGFFAAGEMKKMPAAGGPAQTICQAHGGSASWGSSGDILYSEWGAKTPDALQRVRDSGGPTRLVTGHDVWYFWPVLLSDGNTWVSAGIQEETKGPRGGMVIGTLDGSKAPARISDIVARPQVDSNDNLYYIHEGVLYKQQLDRKARRLTGDAVSIAQSVFEESIVGSANFSVSRNGSVIAVQWMAMPTQLVWRDRDGRETGRVGGPQLCRNFRLSPDGTRLALDLAEPSSQQSNIWIHDLARNVSTRITSARLGVVKPVWMHHANALIVTAGNPARPANAPQLAQLSLADGTLTYRIFDDGPEYPTAITADDSKLIYSINRGAQSDVEMMPASGTPKITALLSSQFNESNAVLSNDDHWLAFEADDSGRPEVYIEPFGRGGERVRVSSDGGGEPRWSTNDRELFFISAAGMLTAVPIDSAGKAGAAVPLFLINSAGMLEMREFSATHYDIDPKSGRFLVKEIPGGVDEAPVTVIVTQ